MNYNILKNKHKLQFYMYLKKLSIFILSFTIITVSLFLLPLKIQAEVVCSDWDNAISKNKEYHKTYHEVRNDVGIFYDFEWDKEKQIIKIKRNKKNYPKVRFSLFNKTVIQQGSIIKSYNGIDLSKKNKSEIEKIHRKAEKAKLELLDGKIVEINSKPYKLNDIKMVDFGLNTIQTIEATKGIVEISFNSFFLNERPDLLKVLKNEKVFKDNIYKPLCNETIDKNYFPIENFIFSEFKYDEEVRSGLNNKTKLNKPFMGISTDKGVLRVLRNEAGVSYYRQDFKFHRFPFDTQKILITISSNQRSTGDPSLNVDKEGAVVTFITPEKGAFINLDEYKKKPFLKEWKVISTNIKSRERIDTNYHDTYLDKTITDNEIQLDIVIEIKRNYEQYIFKIIIPVFLILSVAWFVLWIPTREFETRLTTSMVALLSLIAYNFVFADDVPKLNYLTALDKYILLSYIFCCIPTFMSIWFSRFVLVNQKKATLINKKIRVWGIVIYIIASLWVFFPK